ncbi:MAG: LysM peptidoglycan-binding domain-containing protein [Victivallaceae bacterium]
MNKYLLAAASAAILLAGCTPTVARRPFTETEQQWYDYVKANYPAWNPEPTLPQAYQPSLPADTAPVLTPPSVESAPAAPEAPVSDLVFEEKVGVLDSGVEPAAVDVVMVETAETAAVPAEPETEAKPEGPAATDSEVKETPAETPAAADSTKPELPTEYVVQKGDMLGSIAQKFYGRASQWTVIAKANQATLKGSSTVRPGMKLVIPAP